MQKDAPQSGAAFFQNRACPYFPCHKGVPEGAFSCLFCYCPLYALGDACGGAYTFTSKGIKSCENCDFPHWREHYGAVLQRARAVLERAAGEGGGLARAAEAGTFPYYVRSGRKLLRCGYTTGTCAALAAAGAARLLLQGRAPETVALKTPKGLTVEAELLDQALENGRARCAVRKDGGDDPDVTSGYRIEAAVSRRPQGIMIDGGKGVGRVTKPGLDQPVGAAAINRVPREMIEAAVRRECLAAGYGGGLDVEISVPGGEALAQKTFNPMLGIEGGISILGTSGIVEPMSDQAVVDTIAVELRQAAALGKKRLLLTPGNYGRDFLSRSGLRFPDTPCVRYSNFLGEALDLAAGEGFESVLLVGHIGKLVKAAGGVMNTHSKWADCRMELFCAHGAVCGGDQALCRRLMDAATADACIALLDQAGLRRAVLDSLLGSIQHHLDRRAAGAFSVGAVLFSNVYGLLGQTGGAEKILSQWREAT